ncbi:MAG: hypothetical protein WCD25_07795, partial [Pseudolabrys sp.]
MPSLAAERMRRHRQRQRKGLRCLRIELHEMEIDELIRTPKADMCECLAIERERGSVEAIYCGRSLLCRPTYWRGSAGSSDVISAAFNVEFHFD